MALIETKGIISPQSSTCREGVLANGELSREDLVYRLLGPGALNTLNKTSEP